MEENPESLVSRPPRFPLRGQPWGQPGFRCPFAGQPEDQSQRAPRVSREGRVLFCAVSFMYLIMSAFSPACHVKSPQ